MKLKFFGAAQTVTGSRIQFEHQHFLGLVDCGLFQGPRELRELNWTPQPELLKSECVLLTHAHIDHSGNLPRLYKQGFRKPIYCSKPTKDLLKIMLMDSAKLQEEDAKYANDSKYSHHDPSLPLYTAQDAAGCLELVRDVDWDTWTPLSSSLSFRLVRSGHILGSSYIQLSYTDGKSSRIITFSGDVGGSRSDILREPDPILETDALVIESTYGNRSFAKDDIKVKLASVVNEVYNRGGTLIIPSFAVGRTQDLLLLFQQLKKKNLIPNIPVYLDSPMAHEVTALYLKYLTELKMTVDIHEIEEALNKAVFKHVLSPDESMLLCMSTEPKVIISASGMIQGGRVLHHLKAKLPDPKSGVLFVGFQAHGTKGRLLKEGLNRIRIHHRMVDVEAQIYSIDGLSAHADANELLDWMRRIHVPPKNTIINHGELESSEALKYSIQTDLGWKSVCIPKMEDTINLDEI